jgi:hypothetical protein
MKQLLKIAPLMLSIPFAASAQSGPPANANANGVENAQAGQDKAADAAANANANANAQFGQDTAERAQQQKDADVETRTQMGAETSAAAQAKNDEPATDTAVPTKGKAKKQREKKPG